MFINFKQPVWASYTPACRAGHQVSLNIARAWQAKLACFPHGKYINANCSTYLCERPETERLYQSIDNLRNGLETQAKVYATSVIRFTLEPCNFPLNTFQDFVFTYFKQEQKCEWNYRLLKLFREINEAENHHLMFS